MALTISELSRIAKEIIGSFDKIKGAQDTVVQIEADRAELLQKYKDYKIFYDKFHGIVTAYETERRWLDGTTYTTITQSQIDESAKRSTGNLFFPSTWEKLTPMLTANVNGNPTSNSGSNENITLNDTLDNQGLLAMINLLLNGQSSGVTSHTLANSYSPGAPTIELNSGTQTNGNLLYISGSGTSALVRVTNASGTTITITELIAPTGTIAIGGSVVENIPGFTNTERNFLTSGSYQNILTTLTNRIITRVTTWNTSLTNQLTQLNANQDTAPEIATAKTNIQTAQTAISVWNALPNTGTLGTDSKFTNNNLTNLATAYNARNTQRPTRVTQITNALGTATQDGTTGDIGGTGYYMQRFKGLSLMINATDGPYFQYFIKLKLIDVAKQTNQNELGKLELFNTAVKLFKFKANATNSNIIEVQSVAGLANSDQVVVVCTGQPDIVATVTNISGNNVTLSKPLPPAYTIVQKASIAKAI